jgi:hypothetical protein
MPNVATQSLEATALSQPDHNFAPDFAWALIGGFVVLGISALLYAVIVTWGGLHLHLSLPLEEAAPLSAYSRELAGFFLGGALVVLVGRSLTARTQ